MLVTAQQLYAVEQVPPSRLATNLTSTSTIIRTYKNVKQHTILILWFGVATKAGLIHVVDVPTQGTTCHQGLPFPCSPNNSVTS
jgi:hypothetical protein